MKNSIKVDELRKEKEKLEGDRATLNERVQAVTPKENESFNS